MPPKLVPSTSESKPQTNQPLTTNPIMHGLKLAVPQFTELRPEVWFAVFESALECKQLTSDEARYCQLIPRLPKDILQIIEPILINPPKEGKYVSVKELILKETRPTPKQTIDQLCSRVELGDRKPSVLLREMRIIAGPNVSETLLSELWLRSLPPPVQMMVAVLQGRPLDELAAAADSVAERWDTSNSTASLPFVNNTSVNHSEDAEINAIRKDVEALRVSNTHKSHEALMDELATLRKELTELRTRTKQSSFQDKRRPNRSRDSRGYAQTGELCWYHEEFGRRARKCTSPCALRKTASQGK